MILDNLKMLEGIFNCFHFLHRRMLPRLLQFLHCIRSIIHRQAQISFYLCDICGMYFETVFSFYVLLYHFVGHSLLGLVCFSSFSNIIKWNFSLTLAKLNFYVDMSVWLFVGKQYYSLHMYRCRLVEKLYHNRCYHWNMNLQKKKVANLQPHLFRILF